MDGGSKKVYLLIDGENIDRTLGQILGKKPLPAQRPRWDKIKAFIEKEFQAACRPLFFLNANENVSGSFLQALKIVDEGILKTLQAIHDRKEPGELPGVALVSHDADFKDHLSALKGRHLAIVAFREFLSGEYHGIPNLRVFDIEEDVQAFKEECGPLPRLRSINIKDFDPNKFL
jgi:uncharacterized protein